jgi:hypothetical protein
MESKLERLIKLVYRRWKRDSVKLYGEHPDEETIVCFLDGRLTEKENRAIMAHLISCGRCAEIFAVQAELELSQTEEMPESLLRKFKDLPQGQAVHLEDKTKKYSQLARQIYLSINILQDRETKYESAEPAYRKFAC